MSAVAAIDRLSFPTPWPAVAFRRELGREEATYLVLTKRREGTPGPPFFNHGDWLDRLFHGGPADRVIGYVGFRLEDEGGHITTLAVHPDWRGRRLGEFLLLVALKRIALSGVDAVTLEMRPSNKVAYQLYRKHGFQVIEHRRAYYRDGEDAWVMASRMGDEVYDQRLLELQEEIDPKPHVQDGEVGQVAGRAL